MTSGIGPQAPRLARGRRQDLGQGSLDLGRAAPVQADDGFERALGQLDIADEPDDPAHEHVLQLAVEPQLQRPGTTPSRRRSRR
jgi:hypothetical protein